MSIEKKVNELRELRRMAEELQTAISALQDSIKAHMSEQSIDTLSGVDYKITWKDVTTTRLDTAALQKAMPDIAAKFIRTTTTRRFILN